MCNRLLTLLSLFAIFVASLVAPIDLKLSLYILAGVLLLGIGMLISAWRKTR